MKDCIFCKIIKGDISSETVYEDDIVKVIMDANPSADGHILIIPKKHIEDFTEMDNETLGHINDIAKKMKELIYNKLDNVEGLVLVNNYGKFQAVKHYHLHILPNGLNSSKGISIDEMYSKYMN
ncbi:MAG: HIT domain-containing protein [Bacilli bacterium]|nr:HIT domain-containing protein [Bacilli bacterium]